MAGYTKIRGMVSKLCTARTKASTSLVLLVPVSIMSASGEVLAESENGEARSPVLGEVLEDT